MIKIKIKVEAEAQGQGYANGRNERKKGGGTEERVERRKAKKGAAVTRGFRVPAFTYVLEHSTGGGVCQPGKNMD